MVYNSVNFLENLGFNITSRKKSSYYKKLEFYRKKYFNTYRLESYIEELQEVDRILNNKNPKYMNIFSKEFDLTKVFYKSLEEHVKKHSNAIIMTHGLPNSGKSEVSQSIAVKIKNICKKHGMNSKIYVIFSIAEISKISKELKTGDIIIVDEMPALSGAGSINNKKSMDNITKIVRQKQLFFLFNSPEFIKLKVVNYYIETYGKNYKLKKTRCRIYDKNAELVGMIYVKLHNDKEFRNYYLKRKSENIDKLLKEGGGVVGDINEEKLKKDMIKLLDYAKKFNLEKKSDLEYFASIDPEIKGDTNYMKTLVQGAYFRIRNDIFEYDLSKYFNNIIGSKEQENENDFVDTKDESDEQIYNTNIDFAEFVYNEEKKRTGELIAKIRSMMVDGYTYREISEETGKSNWFIHDKTDKWKSGEAGKDNDCWKLFERWFAMRIGAKTTNVGGNTHEPDVIGPDGEIYSLKIRFDKSRVLTFYQQKDFKPEYELAKKLGKMYHLILLNPFWGRVYKYKDILIDPNDDEKVVVKKES